MSISAHEVCEHDTFDYAFGLAERLEHVPAKGDRGEVAYFYAYAKFKDGGHHFDVMTREDVETIRDNSEGWKSAVASTKKYGKPNKSPWFTSFVEMGKKTAIRRIAKYLPLSVQKAAAMADALDSGKHAHIDRYGDVVIDTTATQQIGTEGQIENAEAESSTGSKPLETSPKDGEVLSPDDAEISDPVGAVEESHDPETGEIQNEPAEPVEFWKRESLEIVPVPSGRTFDWGAWQKEITTRIAQAASKPDLAALKRWNADHIAGLKFKYIRDGVQVEAAFAQREAELQQVEG